MIPSSRKPDDEPKHEAAASRNMEEAPPSPPPPVPRTEQVNENHKRARKRRPKFVL